MLNAQSLETKTVESAHGAHTIIDQVLPALVEDTSRMSQQTDSFGTGLRQELSAVTRTLALGAAATACMALIGATMFEVKIGDLMRSLRSAGLSLEEGTKHTQIVDGDGKIIAGLSRSSKREYQDFEIRKFLRKGGYNYDINTGEITSDD